MKNKYVMVNGLAFSEKGDMEKLKDYAAEGWILDGVVGGFFYKLRKDKPQNIVYTLDYQFDASEEYFDIFKEAQWELVLSINNKMHIFCAPAGTKPIYDDSETEIDKYIDIRNQMKKVAIYSLIIAMVLTGVLVFSSIYTRPIFLITLGLLLIDLTVFVFNFLPYMAYNSKINQIKKHGKCKSEVTDNKISWKIYGFSGVIWSTLGVLSLVKKEYFLAALFICLAVSDIVSSFNRHKKSKTTL